MHSPFNKMTAFQKVVSERKSLRKKIRDIERNTKWPNKRKAARVSRYRARYETLGFEMVSLIPFGGQDLTGVTKYLNDNGEPITKEEYLKIVTNLRSKGGIPSISDGLRVEEDKSQKVGFYENADGDIQMTIDGVDSGNPVPARFYRT